MSKEIYSFFVDNAKLTKKHREKLKVDRGFTDKTIDDCRFVSSGKYLTSLESKLQEKFTREELLASKVMIFDDKNVVMNPDLLKDNIIIPYINHKNEVTLIRPHKYGLKDVPIQIYQEKNISGYHLVLTEGEFKAAAAMQFGFKCIAVPGISSFSKKHFPKLIEILDHNKIRSITILFDNEVKDDPKYPKRFVENPANRYDTEFYAYYMAKRLDREGGLNVKIGRLPDGWRREGKIDIDGALQQRRTKDQMDSVISSAIGYKKFLSGQPKNIKEILLRKNAQKRFSTGIRKEFNHYVATRGKGKREWDEVISNFVIKIVATHETSEGIVREVKFVNEFGQESIPFSMTPDKMSGADAFATFCYANGNFIWKGNKEDLAHIWEGEFLNDDGRHIVEPDHIGWIDKERIWMFGNVAYNAKGEELRPDKNHVYWLEKKGLKPVPLGVTTGKTSISEGVPYLNLSKFDFNEVRSRLSDSLGKNQASLALGWITACVYLEEVFTQHGCFPFLFVTGRRGCGKSTIAEWLMNCFGIENAGKMAADTTAVGMQRYLSYYSSLPVFIDEYRNTKQVISKNGFLRNAYNRQSAGKGIKASFGIREAKIRGTLLMSGEETPEDSALLSRCVVILVQEKNRLSNHFNWFQKHKGQFSNHLINTIKAKPAFCEKFMEIVQEGKDHLVKEANVDDRIATNYGIIAAGYAAAFGEDSVEGINFAEWIGEETQRVKDEYESEHAASVFLSDLLAMKTQGLINDKYWCEDSTGIYIYFAGLHNIWSDYYRRSRGVEAFKKSAIRDYLKEESGLLDLKVVKKIKGQALRCMQFSHESAPEDIKFLVNNNDDDKGFELN